MAWVQAMLALVAALGSKVQVAMPHLKIIMQELEHVLQIMNDGKPIAHGNVDLDATSIKLAEKLEAAGVSAAEARQFATTTQTLAGRV